MRAEALCGQAGSAPPTMLRGPCPLGNGRRASENRHGHETLRHATSASSLTSLGDTVEESK